jgi:signal transduction histidine kinase/CheY-like chemotaxis protein
MTRGWQRFPHWLAGAFAVMLLLLGVAVVTQADRDYRDAQAQRAQIRAEILAANVVAAVDFGDMESAHETAQAFGVDPAARIVGVYAADGRLLTGYARAGSVAPPRITDRLQAGDNVAVGRAPIVRAGERIGASLVVSELEPFSRRLTRYALITLLTVMASLIVGILSLSQAALRRANRELQTSNDALVLQMAERERAESQLRQAQKMESIGQLTGGIAHDFNNMLAIVIGSLDIADRRFDRNPERARAAIGHALEGANRAASLTRRLLAFARQAPLQPQPVDANKLVGGMSELLSRTLGEGISVETQLAGGLWLTHADPSQVENAILNLCVNARDAMDGRGRLVVETSNVVLAEGETDRDGPVSPGPYVGIAIADNGPGMPDDVLARAFEPFFTTKGVGRGTGLGLAQVYGFVKQSGGHVKIDTEPGRGTTVRLFLPRHFGSGEAAQPRDTVRELPRAVPGETVLVVEDEEQVRRMSVETLDELGYTVVEAKDALDALQLLANRADIGLLFTDMIMPDMNGRQLADRVRESRPDLPVLFTTGYAPDAVLRSGLDAGVGFISKPFTVEQLAHRVRAVLDAGR